MLSPKDFWILRKQLPSISGCYPLKSLIVPKDPVR
ncbi:hypothetical protein C5167_002709 [Papaver somniferum]|uniref:Uncharacterized protein n=1 Tax=Papaver somniferum TaxID=3469 RepID=A0A4Y7KYW4_PAPSO|nr:hypothetical protein C5167_002709 [Papaver somniferum]